MSPNRLFFMETGGIQKARQTHRATGQGNQPSLRHAVRLANLLNTMTIVPLDQYCPSSPDGSFGLVDALNWPLEFPRLNIRNGSHSDLHLSVADRPITVFRDLDLQSDFRRESVYSVAEIELFATLLVWWQASRSQPAKADWPRIECLSPLVRTYRNALL